ncbi:MAG TPA: VOC family protein [Gammaproteobacteria bacterium]
MTTVGAITIPTRDPGRAIRFYNRVFGFELVGKTSRNGSLRFLMRGRAYFHLAIDAHRGATAAPKRLRLETASLDLARERLWNLGFVPADRCIEPRFDPKHCCRVVPIRDPDGNEIELVESEPFRLYRVGLGRCNRIVDHDAPCEAVQEDSV